MLPLHLQYGCDGRDVATFPRGLDAEADHRREASVRRRPEDARQNSDATRPYRKHWSVSAKNAGYY